MRNKRTLLGIVIFFIFSSGLTAGELPLLDGQVLRGPGISYNEEGVLIIEEGQIEATKIYWSLIAPEALSNRNRRRQLDFANRYLIEARSIAPSNPERAQSIVDGLRPLAARLDDWARKEINWAEAITVVENIPPSRTSPSSRHSPPPRSTPANSPFGPSQIDDAPKAPKNEITKVISDPEEITEVIENPKGNLSLILIPIFFFTLLIYFLVRAKTRY